jgi:hypothetical protein
MLTGVAHLPLKRSTLAYARHENPLAFFSSVSLFLVVGVVLCLGALWVFRGLASDSSSRRQVNSELLGDIEALAPSGLRPLWVALLVAVAAFAIYVVVT